MIEPIAWMDRQWSFHLEVGLFPALLERIRGTAARVEALLAGVSEEAAAARPGGSWSAKEHLGHLDDLSLLDERRLDDYLAGAEVLSAADVTNRRTEEAAHRTRSAAEIVGQLRRHREAFVSRLEALSAADAERTALHPRLRQPLRLIDWLYFVAEHDDHHLSRARRAIGGG